MNTLRLQNNELLARQRQLEEQLHEQQLQQQQLIERLLQRGLIQSQDEDTQSLLQETQSECKAKFNLFSLTKKERNHSSCLGKKNLTKTGCNCKFYALRPLVKYFASKATLWFLSNCID